MKAKKIVLCTLLAAALMGTAMSGASLAAPMHEMPGDAQEMGGPEGFGPCPGMEGMHGKGAPFTPEQQQKYQAIMDEYTQKMEPVRDQLFVKRQELRALQNAANPDIPAVRAAATELLQFRKQLRQMHAEMSQRLQKEVGMPAGPMPGKDGAPHGKHQQGAHQ